MAKDGQEERNIIQGSEQGVLRGGRCQKERRPKLGILLVQLAILILILIIPAGIRPRYWVRWYPGTRLPWSDHGLCLLGITKTYLGTRVHRVGTPKITRAGFAQQVPTLITIIGISDRFQT